MTKKTTSTTEQIAVALIDPWEHNPRGKEKFTSDALEMLSASLVREGQNHAVTVRKHPTQKGRFQLADGERRWRAAVLAGITHVEARVRVLDDAGMFRVALSSGREGSLMPLSPIEEARGYRDAMQSLGLTQHQVADMFGAERSHTHVQRRLALLDLPAAATEAIEEGALPLATALEMARIPDGAAREEVSALVLKDRESLGVMPLERVKLHIRTAVYRPIASATFDVKDEGLVGLAGPCGVCPHLSTNQSEESKGRALCMRPACFEAKTQAGRERVIAREVAKGRKALSVDENLRAFPPGDTGLALGAGFVDINRPVPADLLKADVTNAPSWSELCGDVAVVYIGFDQAGRLVYLHALREALLAADQNERAIFNADTIRRYNLDKGAVALKKERRAKPGKGDDVASELLQNAQLLEAETEAADEEEDDEPWPVRARDWIKDALEAAPTLPPVMRANGQQLLREGP